MVITSLNNKTVNIEAEPTNTLAYILEQLKIKEGIIPSENCFMFAGSILNNTTILSSLFSTNVYLVPMPKDLRVIELS